MADGSTPGTLGSTAFLKEIDDLLLEADNDEDVDGSLDLGRVTHKLENGWEEDVSPGGEGETPSADTLVNGQDTQHPTKYGPTCCM